MAHFDHILQRAEQKLRTPDPWRSRILLELADDLDALCEAYVSRGMSEADAMQRAEHVLGLDDEAVLELDAVHRPSILRIPGLAGSGCDGFALTIVICAVVIAALGGLVAGGFSVRSSPLLLPLLGTLVVAAVLAATLLRDLLRPGRVLPTLHHRLAGLLTAAAFSVVLGVFGAAHDAWVLAEALAGGSAALTAPLLLEVTRAAELMTLAIIVALLSLLAWFHLHQLSATQRRARAEFRRRRLRYGGEEPSW